MSLDPAFSTRNERRKTHEDKGRVQILVVRSRIIPVELVGFPEIDEEKVGARVVGPQWIEEFLEGGMKAVVGVIVDTLAAIKKGGHTILGRAGWLRLRALDSLLEVETEVETLLAMMH